MGPTIYTNPEYQSRGYSGMIWQEFSWHDFDFKITNGSTSYGGAPAVRAFSVSVKHKTVDVLYMYVYLGHPLFDAIEELDQAKVMQLTFTTALEHTDPVDWITGLLRESRRQGKVEGREEVQYAIQLALGLKGP